LQTHDPTNHPSFVVARIITGPRRKRRISPEGVTLTIPALLEVQATFLLVAFEGRTVKRSCKETPSRRATEEGDTDTVLTDTHDASWVLTAVPENEPQPVVKSNPLFPEYAPLLPDITSLNTDDGSEYSLGVKNPT